MGKLIDRLHDLSDLGILAIVLAAVVLLMTGAPHARARLFPRALPKDFDDKAFEAFKAMVATTGLVLAFSLVQATSNLRQVETTVGRESVALATADRVLLRSGLAGSADARARLEAFGQSRVADEWPTMAHGLRAATTDAAYTEFSKAVRGLAPQDLRQQTMYAELLKAADDIAEFREMVLLDSDLALPDFFWVTTAGLMLCMFGIAALAAPAPGRSVAIGATAAAVGLVLAFVIIADRPFRGETSVSPAPIQKALELNARRI